jgi:transposase
MAPNLAASQHEQIHAMIEAGHLTAEQIAEVAGCSSRSVSAIRSNIRAFGSTRAPFTTSPGRSRSITSEMFDALKELLLRKPDRQLHELAEFLRDDFDVEVSRSTISRTLNAEGWSKKTIRRKAREQNADLRDKYLHELTAFASYHLVYIDESGCDKRVGFRRTGWSPVGSTPVQTERFHRGQRHHILPAYTQDGILLARIYQGSTDGEVFEDFLGELLQWCGRWPQPKSVLVMDNASFHRSHRVEELCAEAGVILMYLPPYSPDLNPIEEFFAELKAFIRRNWRVHQSSHEGFESFLEWCVEVVGERESSAKGHFRHSGVIVERT